MESRQNPVERPYMGEPGLLDKQPELLDEVLRRFKDAWDQLAKM
jgi:hypothetical protein